MIKALRKTSLIDFPNAISSVIFTGGCNFSCKYCYNTDLVYKSHEMKTIPEEYVIELLLSRKKFINHIVITGGEPTLHNILPLLKKLKDNGFIIKLDTNAHSEDFQTLLNYIDYLAIDFKAPLHLYKHITGVQPNIDLLKKNFHLAKTIKHEFRSVLWKEHPLLNNVDEIATTIGNSPYFLQNISLTSGFTPLEEFEFDNFLNQLINHKINVKTRAKF